jgi:hypothetical protein
VSPETVELVALMLMCGLIPVLVIGGTAFSIVRGSEKAKLSLRQAAEDSRWRQQTCERIARLTERMNAVEALLANGGGAAGHSARIAARDRVLNNSGAAGFDGKEAVS